MERKAQFWQDLRGLTELIRPHKKSMILSGFLAVLSEGCGLLPFILIYYLIREVAGHTLADINPEFVWVLVFSGMVAVIGRHIFSALSTALSHKTAYEILYRLRLELSEHLSKLPLGYFNSSTTGRIKKVMLEDVEQMEVFIAHNLPEFTGSFLHILLTMTILFLFDWRLALGVISLWPVGILAQVAMINSRSAKAMTASFYTASEEVNGAMIQYIQGMPVIKAFSRTSDSFEQYRQSVRDIARREDELCRHYFLPMTIFSVTINAGFLVLLPLGSLLFLADSVSLSTLSLFMLMGLGLGGPLFHFITLGAAMGKNMEGRKRIRAIFQEPPLKIPEKGEAPMGTDVKGEELEFSFPDKQVICGVNFSVPARRFLAMVGPSGAGKSTLARLILRFWDVDKGMIGIGKQDIRKMDMDTLMGCITFVFQDNFLFDDTIRVNLKLGQPHATDQQMIEAAQTAQCHEFIMSLPNGYDTVIGERSARISGGEKQRISIARAILKDAPVLVLDEATAFIDPENETLIQEGINALAANKTLIVIAHRLSTITGADQILVVSDGEISEQGTHRKLLAKQGIYRQMWDAHTAGPGWDISGEQSC